MVSSAAYSLSVRFLSSAASCGHIPRALHLSASGASNPWLCHFRASAGSKSAVLHTSASGAVKLYSFHSLALAGSKR